MLVGYKIVKNIDLKRLNLAPIESVAEYILERWKNTCPRLTTMTYITQPIVDLIIQVR